MPKEKDVTNTSLVNLPSSLLRLLENYPLRLEESPSLVSNIKTDTEEYRDFYQTPILYKQEPVPNYKLAKPMTEKERLALHLELQEELEFQKRCAKEKAVILKIKNFVEEKLQHAKTILKIGFEDSECQEFLKNCRYYDEYLKKSDKNKLKIIDALRATDLIDVIQDEINGFEYLLNKINKDIPYLTEALYMEFNKLKNNEVFLKDKVAYKELNHFSKEFSNVLKWLNPFITEEFKVFFEHYQSLPSSKGLGERLNKKDIKNQNEIITNFIPSQLQLVSKLHTHTRGRVQAYQIEKKVDLIELCQILSNMVDEIEPLAEAFIETLRNYCENYSKSIDLTLTPFWQETRAQFSIIYNALKQLEQINQFLDTLPSSNLKLESPSLAPLPIIQPDFIKEAVEGVPELTSLFLPPLLTDKAPSFEQENLNTFFERKKIQLQLWQERIEHRKLQKKGFRLLKSTSSCEDDSKNMTLELAIKLTHKISRLDNSSVDIFDSLFKSQPSCKPHNLLFTDIQKLITQIGGSFEYSGSGSSHFSISLPMIFIEGMPIKKIGGSFRPHGGDEWTRQAHEFCKNAFIKAGITPENIEQAEKIISNTKRNEVKNG